MENIRGYSRILEEEFENWILIHLKQEKYIFVTFSARSLIVYRVKIHFLFNYHENEREDIVSSEWKIILDWNRD